MKPDTFTYLVASLAVGVWSLVAARIWVGDNLITMAGWVASIVGAEVVIRKRRRAESRE